MSRQTELMAISESKGQKRFRFQLREASQGILNMRYAPDGWKDGKFVIERNLIYMGLTRKVSVNELTFVKDARDFIRDCYEATGINAKIRFTVTRLNDSTQTYSIYFDGMIDLSTYNILETGVKVSVIDNSMTEKLKNRENSKVNIRQNISISGYAIPLFTNEYPLLYVKDFNIIDTATWIINSDTDTNALNHYVPLLTNINDFAEAQSQIITLTDPMFHNSTADRNIQVEGKVKGTVTTGGVICTVLTIQLKLYVNGSAVETWTSFANNSGSIGFDFDINENVSVTIGNDISLQAEVQAPGATPTTVYTSCHCEFFQEIVHVAENQNVHGMMIYETLLRNLQIILDDNDVLQSTYFGRTDSEVVTYPSDGQLGHVTKGLFLRGANALNNTLSVTFSDLFKSLSSIFCLGMGVEPVSGVNKVVIEDLSYFFGTDVICDLSARVREDAIEKEILPEWHYNRIKVGYESFTYENSGGLLEFNTKSEFTTVISALDNELDLMAKYRADTSGMIKSRLAGVSGEDADGDDDIFLIDTVRVNPNIWQSRTLEGFTLVTGGPGADQYYNLDWTPKRNLIRNGIRILPGLIRNLGTSIRWQSTEKNTLLTTQLTTETESVIENADVLAYDLAMIAAPYWYAEAYNFDVEMTYSDLTAILANPNGLIKLSDTKYGWILKLEIGNKENKARIKLLRCNLTKVTPT